MTTPPAGAPPTPPARGVRPWAASGWRRYLFPGLWLGYLVQTGTGVHRYQSGWTAVLGYAVILGFAACYLAALSIQWGTRPSRFHGPYVVMMVLFLLETALARQEAFVMCIFITVLTVAHYRRRGVPIIVALTAIASFGPLLVPSWHARPDASWLFTIPLVALAMWGFFGVIQSNAALGVARAEVARLAAENERNRIARDLHDLLGHSLTTITVKAGLARRLAETGQPDRAAAEITEVERLSRRTLTDVRAAVSGHRDITLANELATVREVLRVSDIVADLPGSVDIVDPVNSELFGWVLREGVTNVVRHARATRCALSFGRDWIEIVDDGRGRPGGVATTAAARTGTGLTGLRERVTAAGGTLEASGTGRGWRLRVDMPPASVTTPASTLASGPAGGPAGDPAQATT